jgi:hypothetical protein
MNRAGDQKIAKKIWWPKTSPKPKPKIKLENASAVTSRMTLFPLICLPPGYDRFFLTRIHSAMVNCGLFFALH